MTTHNSCGLCQIQIKNLSVIDGADIILNDVNIEFHCGQLTAIIGRNGAGKTTLLRSLLGEINFNGKIMFNSYDGKSKVKPRIGYVPQYLTFDKNTPLSVLDFINACSSKRPVWLGGNKHTEKSFELLEKLNCSHILNRMIGNLSGGELQRVLLANAINPTPDMLILDEPYSGMDVSGQDLFYKLVMDIRDKFHIAIILVSHDLELVKKYADKAILLDKTVMAQGDVDYVFKTKPFLDTFN